MTALIALTLVCVVTYTVEIIFGLAGTILMLLILSFLFDAKTLVVYSVLPQILVAIIGIARSPNRIDRAFLAGMLAFALIGAVAGFALFYLLPTRLFQIALAAGITAAGVYLIAAPARARLGAVGLRLLDMTAGASQALFGISGPISMTRLLATFPDKNTVRHHAFAFFLTLNLVRVAEYAVHGTFTEEIGRMMLVSGPVLAATLWFSDRLHLRFDDRSFRTVVSWMILIGGLSLFFR